MWPNDTSRTLPEGEVFLEDGGVDKLHRVVGLLNIAEEDTSGVLLLISVPLSHECSSLSYMAFCKEVPVWVAMSSLSSSVC